MFKINRSANKQNKKQHVSVIVIIIINQAVIRFNVISPAVVYFSMWTAANTSRLFTCIVFHFKRLLIVLHVITHQSHCDEFTQANACFSDNVKLEMDIQTFPRVSFELNNAVSSLHCCLLVIKHSAGVLERRNGDSCMQKPEIKSLFDVRFFNRLKRGLNNW